MTTTLPADTASPKARGGLTLARLFSLLPYFGVALLVGVTIYFSIRSDVFFTVDNILNIIVQGSVVAIASFGFVFVVITGGDDVVRGGIDLSSGAIMGLTGGVTALLVSVGAGIPVAVIAGLGAALAVGMLNSFGVLLGIRPLLVTLAVGGIASSADLVFTNNTQIRVSDEFFVWLRDGNVVGLPVPVVVLVVVFAAMWFVMNKTSIGVRSYAVGGHDVAARVAGINPGRYVFASYLVSALTAGIAGLIIVARLSGSTPGVGALMLMDVLLAAFMSVIFSRRLVPNLWGALASAIFIAVLNNGFTLVNVPNYWVSGVKGVLILVVVSISALRARRS